MFDISVSIVSHGRLAEIRSLLSKFVAAKITFNQIIITLNVHEVFLPEIYDFDVGQIICYSNIRPRGFGSNHNFNFTLSDGVGFCVLNSDLDFDATLGKFFEVVMSIGDRNFIGTPAIDSGSVLPLYDRQPLFTKVIRKFSFADERFGQTRRVRWLSGCFMFFSNKCFGKLGGFDQRYFMYHEDIDVSIRAHQILIPSLVFEQFSIVHIGRRASRNSVTHFAMYISSGIKFSLRYFLKCI